MAKIKIGLFGFGVVGQGIYQVIRKAKNANAKIVRICVRNPDKPRAVEVDRALLTTSADEILDDPNVNLVVEVIDAPRPPTTSSSGPSSGASPSSRATRPCWRTTCPS